MTSVEHKRSLVHLARDAVRQALGGPRHAWPVGSWAETPTATFVTWHRAGGDLQGCIGSLEPRRALASDVASNAVAAAIDDPRALPLAADDVDALGLEISLLGPLETVPAATEEQAIAALSPGLDGVVLRYRGHRATFLPQVWSSLPEPRTFLAELKRKAGLSADFWSSEMMVQRYRVEVIDDPPARAAREGGYHS